MTHNITKHLFASSVLVALAASISPASAQEATAPVPGEATPACMTGKLGDVPQVRANLRGRSYPIVVAKQDVPFLQSHGFELTDCGALNPGRLRQFLKYRDEICLIADTGNEAVQGQYQRILGVRPAVLCSSMELVAGRWQRPPKGQRPTFDFLIN
ncbi:MAG: hypothetical protein ABGW84_02920 [Sphingomonadaceae bacterium]